MSGKSINELGVETESYGVAPRKVEDMPAQFGGFRAIPQPDRYRFRLPANLAQVWEVTNPLVVEGFGDGQPHRFAYAKFDEDNPLVIIGASERNKDWVNEPFQIRISSYPRNRAKKDEAAQFASALDYLLTKALGETVVPGSPSEYAAALVRHAGAEFTATISYSWQSRKDVFIRCRDENKQLVEMNGVKGNGDRKYMNKDVKKDEATGLWPNEIIVPLQIGDQTYYQSLFANLDLENFQK